MLQQYFRAKAEHPGVLMAMRVGDFYEFYGEDAETAASTLEITLTGRDDGGNRIAMAGVPYHSVEKYLARLIQAGHKVALCDQLEDPKQAKGLVKRGVTRVMTPGTVVEDSILNAGQNNFLAAICVLEGRIGLATLDPSTGEFAVTELGGDEMQERLLAELARLRPSELLVGPKAEEFGTLAHRGLGSSVTEQNAPAPDRAARKLMEQLDVSNLAGFGCADKPSAQIAAAMILNYAERNGLNLGHVDSINTYSVDGFMRLDNATRRSLELTQNLQDGSKRFTLLAALDATQTPMGSRLIRRWVEQPLLDPAEIEARLGAVERFKENPLVRGDAQDELKRVADIERLVSRCATGQAGPRDLAALRDSLGALPKLEDTLAKVSFGRIQEAKSRMGDHTDLRRLLEQAVVADPPHALREGGILKAGFDLELDKLRELSKSGKSYIAQLEQAEREKTGIANLKVGFNSVFGYYLEVTKSNVDKVPADYIRKQTTANGERFITAELKEHESLVLGAEEKAASLEAELFHRLRAQVAEQASSLLQTARAIAEIDVLCGLADVAQRRNYVRPKLRDDDALSLRACRHAVVETANPTFVPNDLELGASEAPETDLRTRAIVLTGPNMSGKSTFLRQTALAMLMAQIGCFVPASHAEVGLCDRIFARIGARDELALGQSTFMVEMVESANILNHSTSRSLVILDEVGRGTSTYDGLAIAWAMMEHLAEVGCRTLFATHYHQMNALADSIATVANFRVVVEELGSDILWTHRVAPGGADRSYGIHVAKMAGVPGVVLSRAQEILEELEEKDSGPRTFSPSTQKVQLTLFEVEKPPVQAALDKLDVNRLTPIEALTLLDDWKRRFGGNQG